MNDIEYYLKNGCMRCPLGGTPACKVNQWNEVLIKLRGVVLATGVLEETIKWGAPCYMVEGHNVLMLTALKECVVVGFFKGILLDDPQGMLEQQGPNSHAARIVRFSEGGDVEKGAGALTLLIHQAARLERDRVPLPARTETAQLPNEWVMATEADEALKSAFEALTPGRQRGYLLHFSQAKQSKTRSRRIAQCRENILAGKGLHDR